LFSRASKNSFPNLVSIRNVIINIIEADTNAMLDILPPIAVQIHHLRRQEKSKKRAPRKLTVAAGEHLQGVSV
jgi:hypothetical protein